MNTPVIEVRSLSFAYGSQQVLDDVSFTVAAKTFTVLAGPNGAGKTTLIRCILGFFRPRTGDVRLWGQRVWAHPELCRRLGIAAEASDLPPAWSLAQLARWLHLAGRLTAQGQAELLETAVRLGLPPATPLGALSRGERSLAQLAVALAPRPELLVLDEPTLGVDVVAQERALDLLLGFLEETECTVLLATQDLTLAERLASHVVMLHGGECTWSGPLDELKASFALVTLPSAETSVAGGEVCARQEVLGGIQTTVRINDSKAFASWCQSQGLVARTPGLGQVAWALWQG